MIILFQNILFLRKKFLHAMAVLDYLPKLKSSLGLAFGAHFLHDFSIKMFLIWYPINGKSLSVIPFFFWRYQTKCVIPLRCLINGGGPEGQNKWRGQRFLLDLINQGGWDLKKSVNISNEWKRDKYLILILNLKVSKHEVKLVRPR